MSPSREDRRRLFASLGLSAVLQIPLAFVFFAATMLWYAIVPEEQSIGKPSLDRRGITMLVIERRPAAAAAVLRPAHNVAMGRKHHEAKGRPRLIASRLKTLSVVRRSAVAERVAPVRSESTNARAASDTEKARSEDTATEPIASSAASPAPSAPPAVAAVAASVSQQPASQRGSDGPIGGWGQNFEKPMVADESALADLRAKYHFSAPIGVRIDENGKALKFVWPDSIPSDARAEIEKRLVALHYVPAECNGLRCAATLQITL